MRNCLFTLALDSCRNWWYEAESRKLKVVKQLFSEEQRKVYWSEWTHPASNWLGTWFPIFSSLQSQKNSFTSPPHFTTCNYKLRATSQKYCSSTWLFECKIIYIGQGGNDFRLLKIVDSGDLWIYNLRNIDKCHCKSTFPMSLMRKWQPYLDFIFARFMNTTDPKRK